MPSFRTLGQLLKLPPFSAQNLHSAGGRRGPRFLLLLEPCKDLKPYNNPFWGFE
jgi:hypothetical protein